MSDLKSLDLESLEAILQGKEKNGASEHEDRHHKKKKHRSSRSGSGSRSHKKKSRKRSKSRSHSKREKSSRSHKRSTSRSKDRRKHSESSRRKSKDRDREKEKGRDRENGEDKHEDNAPASKDDEIDLKIIEERQNERLQKEEEERKKREAKAFDEKIADAKKQLEEARRDDSTCLILNLSIKSEERDIYEFFTKTNCGKIRDIRVIKDPRSGKSKGVSYVEFYTLESVNKAIAQSGKELQGSKIRVLPSKAEINRTAAAAKLMKQTKNPAEQHQQATGAMRVFVSGLTDQLADIEEKDLRDLFQPFGEVDRVDLHRDDVTGKSKGYAFVLFRNSGDARRAIIEMDGFVVNNKKIKVQPIQAGMANMLQDNSNFDLDDESGNNYLQTSQSKTLLMQKLQRENPQGSLIPGMEFAGQAQGQSQQPVEQAPVKPQTSLLPTNCILLSNMFDTTEVDLANEPGYFVDLKEEIEEECKKYGDIEHVFIEATRAGNIWIKFKDGRGASVAYQTLNNKFFSGRKIICSYVTDNTFNTKIRSS